MITFLPILNDRVHQYYIMVLDSMIEIRTQKCGRTKTANCFLLRQGQDEDLELLCSHSYAEQAYPIGYIFSEAQALKLVGQCSSRKFGCGSFMNDKGFFRKYFGHTALQMEVEIEKATKKTPQPQLLESEKEYQDGYLASKEATKRYRQAMAKYNESHWLLNPQHSVRV